jgi:hypothetical protein
MSKKIILCLCGLLVALGILLAEEKWTTLSDPTVIESVTVFQNRAMIVRSLAHDFIPGLYALKLSNLPAQLLEESVRASGRGTAAAKILDIRVIEEFMTESGQEALRNMEKKIQEVDNQIQEITDRLEVLNKKADFIKALSTLKAPDEKGANIVLSGGSAEWAKTLDFVDSQLTQILGQARRLNIEKKELERKRSVFQYELQQQSSLQKKERKTILIEMEVTRPGSEKVEISYVVPGISWIPGYDLRVDSSKKEALLTYQALVKQETGEDWNSVQLSLSTASPALEKHAPQLQAWIVNTADSELGALACTVTDEEGLGLPGASVTVMNGNVTQKAVTEANGQALFFNLRPGSYDLRAELMGFNTSVRKGIEVRAGRSARLSIVLAMAALQEEVSVTSKVKYEDIGAAAAPAAGEEEKEKEMETETAVTSNRSISAVFSLKGRQTIPSSSEQKKVTIAVEALPVEKEYLAIPKLAEKVFLTANLTNSTDFPLLPGKASLFYDEDYVSTAAVPQVVPNERFTVNVGEIPGIKVKWQLLNKRRSETGLIGKKVRLIYDSKITVENLLNSAQTILVKDQIPITTSKDVTIEVLQVTPPPQKNKDEDETRSGTLSWLLELQPRDKKEILLKFQITHPKSKPLIDLSD